MRTGRTDQSRPADAGRRRAPASPGAGADFTRFLSAGDADAPAETVPAHGLVGLESLLGIQEVGEDGANRRRRAAAEYGDALLDRLDRLRFDLLEGDPSSASLVALAQALQGERRRSRDPRLDNVLDEIELRAEVEMAKLTRAD